MFKSVTEKFDTHFNSPSHIIQPISETFHIGQKIHYFKQPRNTNSLFSHTFQIFHSYFNKLQKHFTQISIILDKYWYYIILLKNGKLVVQTFSQVLNFILMFSSL